MTRKNILSLLTAGVMGISCFSMNVTAESAYAAGDVDMDGMVTGHDTAMVSRYLLDEDYTLTDEQLTLADVDADGEVTQADADKLYNEMQVYKLGKVIWENETTYLTISDSSKVMEYYMHISRGLDYEDMNQVQKNLSDMDLDGDIDCIDSELILQLVTSNMAGLDDANAENGIYYYSADEDSPAYVSNFTFQHDDVDMDGLYTGHDRAMMSRYTLEENYTLTEAQLKNAVYWQDRDSKLLLGDVKWSADGEESVVDTQDAMEIINHYVHTAAGLEYSGMNDVQRNLADVDLDGRIGLSDASIVLTLYALRGSDRPDPNYEKGIYYYSLDPESPAYLDASAS